MRLNCASTIVVDAGDVSTAQSKSPNVTSLPITANSQITQNVSRSVITNENATVDESWLRTLHDVSCKIDQNNALCADTFSATKDHPNREAVVVQFVKGERDRATVGLHVFDQAITALIDTGADSCYIRDDVFSRLRVVRDLEED